MTRRLISFEFFCPLHSKNVFLLALAHVEPELELFVEVDGIGDDGDNYSLSPKLQTALARVLPELGPKWKHF